MRVGIATVHTPGIYGGAEFLMDGLVEAVRTAGHSVHKISIPFFFEPIEVAGQTMDQCIASDYMRFDGGQIDRMICLKFPAYMFKHTDKRVWLLHQHRSAYDLYETPYGWQPNNPTTTLLRDRIIQQDKVSLDGKTLGSARAVYTIAERVSSRLLQYNGITSKALYHPPANESEFYCEEALPYIFIPSRLESLKRQDLVLKALAKCKTPINAVFAGTGGMQAYLEVLADQLGIADHVRFLGAISRKDMLNLYANSTAVFFGPMDEDYGYVTLEAMLSGKPVITCTDSGGPLEFVLDQETGYITNPSPEAVAIALERLMESPSLAAKMGKAARSHYDGMDINWNQVAETLLEELPVQQVDNMSNSA